MATKSPLIEYSAKRGPDSHKTSKAINYGTEIKRHLCQMPPLKIRPTLTAPSIKYAFMHFSAVKWKSGKHGGKMSKKRVVGGNQRDKNPHTHSICWHATKAISKFNLCGSILAVPHINDDCWLALFECFNFITTIPNQFFTPDTNTTSRRHTLAHNSHTLPVLRCSGMYIKIREETQLYSKKKNGVRPERCMIYSLMWEQVFTMKNNNVLVEKLSPNVYLQKLSYYVNSSAGFS